MFGQTNIGARLMAPIPQQCNIKEIPNMGIRSTQQLYDKTMCE